MIFIGTATSIYIYLAHVGQYFSLFNLRTRLVLGLSTLQVVVSGVNGKQTALLCLGGTWTAKPLSARMCCAVLTLQADAGTYPRGNSGATTSNCWSFAEVPSQLLHLATPTTTQNGARASKKPRLDGDQHGQTALATGNARSWISGLLGGEHDGSVGVQYEMGGRLRSRLKSLLLATMNVIS